jgi:hypothetical protein
LKEDRVGRVEDVERDVFETREDQQIAEEPIMGDCFQLLGLDVLGAFRASIPVGIELEERAQRALVAVTEQLGRADVGDLRAGLQMAKRGHSHYPLKRLWRRSHAFPQRL